jgi:hypothetical protein
MPRPDPTPPSYDRRALAWRRYRRLMIWMGVAALIAIVAALAYLKSSGDPVPLPMVIATIFGVGFSVLLGTGLMGLVFVSNSSGYDEEAGGSDEER